MSQVLKPAQLVFCEVCGESCQIIFSDGSSSNWIRSFSEFTSEIRLAQKTSKIVVAEVVWLRDQLESSVLYDFFIAKRVDAIVQMMDHRPPAYVVN